MQDLTSGKGRNAVIQRFEVLHPERRVPLLHSLCNDKISNFRIFREQRPVQVRTQHLPVIISFISGMEAVTAAADYLAQRSGHVQCLTAVVFKADDPGSAVIQIGIYDNVSDAPGPGLSCLRTVGVEPQSLDSGSVSCNIILSKQLVASADQQGKGAFVQCLADVVPAMTKSATSGFFGSRGPCRYVPSICPS